MRIGLSLKLSEPKYNVLAQNIRALFADGSQGWWYDDNDTTTLFQDSAGTTPVTAVEQFVGLQLDKSKGLVLGPEQAPTGTVSDFVTTSTATIVGSTFNIPATNDEVRANTGSEVLNSWYVMEWVISGVAGQTVNVGIRNYTVGNETTATFTLTGATQTIRLYRLASANGSIRTRIQKTPASTATSITFYSYSVRELPGNHRYAPASGNRPIWSKRVNLLTKTEQFDDAAWTKTRASITANTTIAPNGTLTGDKLVEDTTASASHFITSVAVSFTSGTAYTLSAYAKADERSQFGFNMQSSVAGIDAALFNLATGSVIQNGSFSSTSITPVGNGWYLCTGTITATGTASAGVILRLALNGNTSYTGDGTSGIYIWGADLRPANQATGLLPLYQRVNTSTDYDTNGFPGYLKADGVDDFLQTNSIDFTATDKITLCAGVRKLSDAASAMFAELSVNAVLNTGAFNVQAPVTGGNSEYRYLGGGTTVRNVLVSGYAAPITNVLTGVQDISGDSILLRINGTQVGSTNLDQGTGNLGNYVTYFFRRGGTTFPFNGYEYGNIAVGKLLTADQLTALETYMNGLTKAY